MSPWHPETADRPFNDLPHLPPAVDLETQPVLKQCIAARAALAELKQATELIPNPAMLINTLPLLEAKASSEIENIVTTADRIFRHLSATGPTDAATKEALRYRHALLEAYGTLSERPVTTRTAEEICSRIRGTDMRIRRVPGTALANDATGEVIYTPPESEARIRDLLTNWERFLHGAEDPNTRNVSAREPNARDHDTGDPPPAPPLDPLVRMAVAHYQFEAIHPFTDGNGRTGRVLNSLFLVEQGLLPLPILYLSRYIIAHKADYYRLLLDVSREAAWEPWLLYLIQGVEETATWTHAKIAAIRTLAEETTERVRTELPKIYSRELVDLLFEQPYLRIANVVDAGIAKRETASKYLKALAAIGVLADEKVGRERLFVNTRLLGILAPEIAHELR